MDDLYKQECEKFVNGIEMYFNGSITKEELVALESNTLLFFELDSWDTIIKNTRNEIFEMTLELFNRINDTEKSISTYAKITDPKEIECDLQSIFEHALILGRNKVAPPEFESSTWYLEPYPTVQMIEALEDDIEALQIE